MMISEFVEKAVARMDLARLTALLFLAFPDPVRKAQQSSKIGTPIVQDYDHKYQAIPRVTCDCGVHSYNRIQPTTSPRTLSLYMSISLLWSPTVLLASVWWTGTAPAAMQSSSDLLRFMVCALVLYNGRAFNAKL